MDSFTRNLSDEYLDSLYTEVFKVDKDCIAQSKLDKDEKLTCNGHINF